MPNDPSAKLDLLNTMHSREAQEIFKSCCGSQRWAEAMVLARPFSNEAQLLKHSGAVWKKCSSDDYLEAFTAHPRIGAKKKAKSQSERSGAWSSDEQKSTRDAQDATLSALERDNEIYYERFGFIFIICATGKSAEQMLNALQQRLNNDRPTEIASAATEQNEITKLRLQKWLHT